MAAKHTISSDFLPEFTCTPCSNEDNNKEATAFCVECNEYFCDNCLKFHNRLGALKGHQILEKKAFRQAKKTPATYAGLDLPTDKCRRHFNKVVDMYCEKHNMIGCSVCVALEHRLCESVLYIPDIADDRLKGLYVQAVTGELAKTLVDIKDLKQDRLDHKNRIADERDSGLNNIELRRKAINEYLDSIDTEVKKRVTDKHSEFSSKLEGEVKTCEDAIELLEEMNSKLQTACSPAQTFVNVKRTEQNIKQIEGKIEKCLNSKSDRLTISNKLCECITITPENRTSLVFGEANGEERFDPTIHLDGSTCAICSESFTNPKTLIKCGHTFCTECIDDYFKVKPICPFCFTVYGVLVGTQPEGEMQVEMLRRCKVPGYDVFGAIRIRYCFPDGIQGAEHPNPGQNYYGTRRTAYLPDTKDGQNVLKLLQVAFQRRLVFTIRRSLTSGLENAVTWNDIHHKTNIAGGPSNYGYPDPDYLTQVTKDLEAKGVTEADIK